MSSYWIDNFLNKKIPKYFKMEEIVDTLNKIAEDFNKAFRERCAADNYMYTECFVEAKVKGDNSFEITNTCLIKFTLTEDKRIINVNANHLGKEETFQITYKSGKYVAFNNTYRYEEDTLGNVLDRAIELTLNIK